MNRSTKYNNWRNPVTNTKAIGFTIAFVLVGAMFLMTGCGGGGGGSSLPAAGVPYVGSTSKATLDETIATAIVVDMAGAELEDLSGYAATAAATVGISDSDGKALRYAALDRFKQDAYHVVEETLNPSVSGSSHEEFGNCSVLGGSYTNGSASQTVLEQTSSTISVKVTYNSLCMTDELNYSVVLNGDMYMVISGSNLNNASNRIDSMRFYMPSFSVAYTDLTISETTTATITEDWIIGFTYDVDGSLTGTTFSLGVNVSFNGKVYRFEAVSNDGLGPTYTEKFYHPDYGYVEIMVAGTFTYGNCGDSYTPDSGSVTITGSNGASSVTYQVTVTGCGNYSAVQL